jgi:hypothetical protein
MAFLMWRHDRHSERSTFHGPLRQVVVDLHPQDHRRAGDGLCKLSGFRQNKFDLLHFLTFYNCKSNHYNCFTNSFLLSWCLLRGLSCKLDLGNRTQNLILYPFSESACMSESLKQSLNIFAFFKFDKNRKKNDFFFWKWFTYEL